MAQKCRIYCAENGLQFATYQTYSLDFTRSRTIRFLSLHTWQVLFVPMIFPSHETLLVMINKIMITIPIETLNNVFEHWIERLNGFLKAMAITIHKFNISWFNFLEFLPGNEILHLSEISCICLPCRKFG